MKIVEEFAKTLEKELDYTIEATNLERVAQQFLNNPTVYIPKVYKDTTTTRVLTTEYVRGIKISQVDRIDAEGYVYSNEFGTYKLVNRRLFSYANFNNNRFQTAS